MRNVDPEGLDADNFDLSGNDISPLRPDAFPRLRTPDPARGPQPLPFIGLCLAFGMLLAADEACAGNCDDCENRYADIEALVNEVKRRYQEYQQDANKLRERGRNSRAGHRRAFGQAQGRLQDALRKARRRKCTQVRPPDADYWATVAL